MHLWNRMGQYEEKWKKTCFVIQKNIFSLLLVFGCSFGFAFPRWFVELENALLWHFKSLKMEKNWQRFAKVISDRLVMGDGLLYPTTMGLCQMEMYQEWMRRCFIMYLQLMFGTSSLPNIYLFSRIKFGSFKLVLLDFQ